MMCALKIQDKRLLSPASKAVSVPVSIQGWINRSLASVTIRDGRAVSCYHRGKSRSGTFFGCMNAIVAAIWAAEAPPKKAA